MKKNVRIAVFGIGLTTLALCVGYKEREANADQVPTPVVQAPANNPTAAAAAAPALAAPTDAAALEKEPAVNAAAEPATGPKLATNDAPAAVTPDTLKPSPALAEVVRLLQAGVSEDVLLAYITNSTEVFNMGADEVLFLHDLGAPPAVITSLIQRDASPEIMAQKQANGTAKPLPPGLVLHKPATNIFISQLAPPTNNPPQPSPAGPPPTAVAADAPQTAPLTPPVMDQPADVSYFYDEMAPYGSWVEVAGYGRCWRPTIGIWNSSWRPYADGGRWIWSNCGWYWYSDYSWGWAPFHYGRWTCPTGLGWVWVPGTSWGPAWVSWRYSSSYCGWAPLPPSAQFVLGHGFYHNGISVGVGFNWSLRDRDFVFLPTGRFCDSRPSRYYLAANHANTVFKETTVVNNYVTVNKTTVVNNGVGFERIASATRGNIRQVVLKGTSDVRNTNTRRETLDSDGKTLTVAQPTVSTDSKSKSSPSAVTPIRPRTERVTGTAPAPRAAGDGNQLSQDSSKQPSRLQNPSSASAQPTFVAPRSAGPLTRPTSTQPAYSPGTSSVEHNQDQVKGGSPVTTPTSPGNAKVGPPRGTRSDPPIVVRRAPSFAENVPSAPSPSSPPARAEQGRNFTPPGAVRAPVARVPEPIARPTAPPASSGRAPNFAPNVNVAPSRPSVAPPSRSETYRAPAPAAPPPAVHSSPPPQSRSESRSSGESRSSHSDDSGRRGGR